MIKIENFDLLNSSGIGYGGHGEVKEELSLIMKSGF